MIPVDKLNSLFRTPQLTRRRKVLALAFAFAADLLQIGLLPLAWAGAQQAIDVLAMVVTMSLMGFHVLLLPTFAIELVPGVNLIPTWTGCVIAVIAFRRNEQPPSSGSSPESGQVRPPKQIHSPPPDSNPD